MEREYKLVEDHPDLVKDTKSHAVINRNVGAYEKAKKRAAAAQAQRDGLQETTREIDYLKSEMTEIKTLLKELVGKQ